MTATMFPVLWAGVCGSDRIRFAAGQATVTLGHEAVVAGPNGPAVGRPFHGCGRCQSCLGNLPVFCPDVITVGHGPGPGAFSGALSCHLGDLVTVPLLDPAYVLADPVAVILNALSRVEDSPTSVAIIGRGAMAGIAAAVVAQRYGTRAHQLPNSVAVDRSAADYGLVIEVRGGATAAALDAAVTVAGPRGTVLSVGVFDPNSFLTVAPRTWLAREVAVIGVHGYRYGPAIDDLADAVNLITAHMDTYRALIALAGELTPGNAQAVLSGTPTGARAVLVGALR